MGWENPGGARRAHRRHSSLLIVFVIIETRVAEPMFRLALFKIREFTAGNVAGLLVSIARGGIQFMLIIWLQGIWLPLHGYSYDQTPLWAGIFLLPMTAGLPGVRARSRASCPTSSARGASRPPGTAVFASQLRRADAAARELPVLGVRAARRPERDRQRDVRLAELLLDHGQRPGRDRGAASGMRATFQNSGTAVSIGVVFTLMIAGLSSSLPSTLTSGLTRLGVPSGVAHQVALAAAGVVAVRLGARRQPDPAPAGADRRALAAAGRQPGRRSPGGSSSRACCPGRSTAA